MKKKLLELRSPTSVNVTLTRKCNQYCSFCYLDCQPENSFGSYEKIKKIIDKSADAEVFEINLFGGEPTLHPNFLEIVRYCKDCGFNVGFSSNGILVDEKMVKGIESYIDGVTISIHSFRKTHEGLTHTKNSYDKALNAVKLLLEANIPTSVNFTLNKKNKDELYSFGKFILSNYNIGSFEVGRLIQRGRGRKYRNILDLSLEEYNKYFGEIYKLSKEYNGRVQVSDAFPFCLLEKEEYRKLVHGCSAGIEFCGIEENGDVKICNAFNFAIGNIFENSLESIWQNSEELENYRSLKWIPEPCKNCKWFDECLCGCKGSSEYLWDILLLENQNKKVTNLRTEMNQKKIKKKGVEIDSLSKPKLSQNMKFRKDLEGYLIYLPGSPLYFANKIGAEILGKCNGKKDIRNIAKEIANKYSRDYNIVKEDVKTFLNKFGDYITYEQVKKF